MVRRNDPEKRREWERRFRRFQTSGLTIGRFCNQENLAVHTFHYWARRLRSMEASQPGMEGGRSASDTPGLGQSQANRRSVDRSRSAPSEAPMVRFLFDAGVQVSIPTDCLEAIRCVAQSVQRPSITQDSSFREVIVRDSSPENR